jgi:hypothetical protein
MFFDLLILMFTYFFNQIKPRIDMVWYLFQYLLEILLARLSVLNMFGGLFHQFTTLK